jgi:hypothetical protein
MDMMDCVLSLSEVDLGLPHSLEYLYYGYGQHNILHIPSINTLKNVVIQDLFHSRRGQNPSYP